MKKVFNFINKYKYIFISGMLGLLSFIYIYGVKVLNPSYIDWILTVGNDLGQHYLGWEFYRNSPWMFPIGMITTAVYPNAISVIFTDSIPILAVIFKLFSSILPSSFQYLGIYGALCFILQGVTSSIILKKFIKNDYFVCLLSIFFILSPVMIDRMFYHTALASHYLILLSIILLLYKDKFNITKNIIYWGLLGLICSSTHIYILLIDGIILIGYVLYELLTTKNYKKALLSLLSYLLFSCITVFLLGGFTADLSTSHTEFGIFNYNLCGIFDGAGYSKIITTPFCSNNDQMEGFAYLGFGLILGLGLSVFCLLYLFFKGKFKKNNKKLIFSLLFLCIISLLLSSMNQIYFGDNLLYEFDLSFINKLLFLFRSNGRIIWIMYYILIIAIIYILYNTFNKKIFFIVAILLLSIQIYDLSDTFENKNFFYTFNFEYQSSNELSQLFKEDFDHVVLLSNYIFDHGKMYEIDKLVIENNKTINRFYLAQDIMDDTIDEQISSVLVNIDDRSIYIFPVEYLFKYDQLDLNYYLISNTYVLTTLDLEYDKDVLRNRIELPISSYNNIKLNIDSEYRIIFNGITYDKKDYVSINGSKDIVACDDFEICDFNNLTYYIKDEIDIYINIENLDDLTGIIVEKIK